MRALPGLKPAQRGASRGITEEVVHLRVTAPGAPELTLVDLPGLRVATEGQRPKRPGTDETPIEDLHRAFTKHSAGRLCLQR